MADSILGLLHNLKDYQHYKGEPYKLMEDEKDILVAFLERGDVQKCIPKAPKIIGDNYACPRLGCRTVVWKDQEKCVCGQRIKWVEESNEKADHVGSAIFDNFDVSICEFNKHAFVESKEEVDRSKKDR